MSMASLKTMSTAQLIPIGDFLKASSVNEIPKEREPLVLPEDMAPSAAFKKMGEEWVRACPVMSGTEIIGTIDLRDAAKAVVDTFKNGLQAGKNGARRRGATPTRTPSLAGARPSSASLSLPLFSLSSLSSHSLSPLPRILLLLHLLHSCHVLVVRPKCPLSLSRPLAQNPPTMSAQVKQEYVCCRPA